MHGNRELYRLVVQGKGTFPDGMRKHRTEKMCNYIRCLLLPSAEKFINIRLLRLCRCCSSSNAGRTSWCRTVCGEDVQTCRWKKKLKSSQEDKHQIKLSGNWKFHQPKWDPVRFVVISWFSVRWGGEFVALMGRFLYSTAFYLDDWVYYQVKWMFLWSCCCISLVWCYELYLKWIIHKGLPTFF